MTAINLSELSDTQLELELAKCKRVKEIASIVEKHPLLCETVTRIHVDSSDLEAFIRTVFGRNYESAEVEEMSNDTEKSYNAEGFGPDVPEWEKTKVARIEAFLYGDDSSKTIAPALSHLLNYLADKNYIEKGNYTIRWSW